MIKIKFFLITFYIKLKLLSLTPKMDLLKKCIKILTNLLYILILYIYMPDMLIQNSNIDDENKDKMLFMACFIIFSGIMSYVLQNYQWKPPGSMSDSDIVSNIDINNMEPAGATGWKRTLLRILLAFR